MAHSKKITAHGGVVDGKSIYYVEIIADTAADIPDPAEHPEWEIGSTLIVLEGGGAKYMLSNARKWAKVNFDMGGGGSSVTSGVPKIKTLESGMQFAHVSLSGVSDVGSPIVGHDAFYAPLGFGSIRRVSFSDGSTTDYAAISTEGMQCWLTHLGYGNGVYLGVDTQNGRVYQSEDCVTWEMMGDVQIAPTDVTNISFSNDDFFFATSAGTIGVCLKSEDYRRITDYSMYYTDVVNAGLKNVYGRFGSHFFVTDTGIISGNSGGGEIRRLAFLEEAPEDTYITTTVAFWNHHIVIFTDDYQLIYTMPMRFPHDSGGNFIDPEWHFYSDGNWQQEVRPTGVCTYGDSLVVITNRHIYCIDKSGEITQLTESEINCDAVLSVCVAEGTILVSVNANQAYQFFFE